MDRPVRDEDDLREFLNNIKFNPSCVNLDWQWEVKEVLGPADKKDQLNLDAVVVGWLVRTSFVRPDTNTGEVMRGFGRWELVPVGATESTVVKTAWLLAKLIVEHELMEAFTYKDVRIFNPHHTVEELSVPHRVKNGDVVIEQNRVRMMNALREAVTDKPLHDDSERAVNSLINQAEARRLAVSRRMWENFAMQHYEVLKYGLRDGHTVVLEDEPAPVGDVYRRWAGRVFLVRDSDVTTSDRNWVKQMTHAFMAGYIMLDEKFARPLGLWIDFLKGLNAIGLGPRE